MYVFVQSNFTDAPHALHEVEDCLARGLTTNDFKVFISPEGDAKMSAKEPPVVEEPEEAPKGKKKDEGPKFDPAGYLYWAKLKKEVPVNIIDPSAIDNLDQPEEVKLALHGSRTLLDQGHMLIVVIQPSQPLDEKFD
ncbi:MAG: hypothetical protein UDG94_04745 [Peptococcaceae bacterium]|nr:hypothetical protein [Peptococcaceae bacterium]